MLLGRGGAHSRAAVPTLISVLGEKSTPDDSPRLWSLRALGLMGRDGAKAVPAIIGIVREPTSSLLERRAAIEALSLVGEREPRAVACLVAVVRTPREYVPGVSEGDAELLREDAILGVGMLGPAAAISVPYLVRLLRHPSEDLRRSSVEALGRMGSHAEIALPELMEVLFFDDSATIRDAAERTVAMIGPAALPTLLRMLSHPRAETRGRAAATLGRIGPRASQALSSVEALLKDSESLVRVKGAEASGRISHRWDKGLPVLVALLESSERDIRRQAVQLLEEIGPQGKSLLPEVRRLERDRRSHVQAAARRVRRAMERPSPLEEKPRSLPAAPR